MPNRSVHKNYCKMRDETDANKIEQVPSSTAQKVIQIDAVEKKSSRMSTTYYRHRVTASVSEAVRNNGYEDVVTSHYVWK